MVSFCFNSGELPITQPTLYEYTWDMEQKLWIAWGKLVPKYVHVPERKFNEILVPTVDTVRTTWLLSLMVRIKRPVVLVGETGTSKSATIGNFLRTLDQDSHVRYHTLILSLYLVLKLLSAFYASATICSFLHTLDQDSHVRLVI